MTFHSHRVRSLAALLLFVSISALAATGEGDLPQYTFDVWDASHGLPQSSVQAVSQSSAGYIWIGTMGGLARFDGLRFTVFDKRNTPLLQDNVIQSLLCDGAGSGSERARAAWPSMRKAGSVAPRLFV